MRLNLGSGNQPLRGFVNVDLYEPADVVGDFLAMDFEGVEEVEMSHVLEHLPFRHTAEALDRVHSWMEPGAPIRVEVPDCRELCAKNPDDGDWNQWMFGSQGHEGEFHRAGFTAESLERVLERAGFAVQDVRAFVSGNANRIGYPCIEARAVKPLSLSDEATA